MRLVIIGAGGHAAVIADAALAGAAAGRAVEIVGCVGEPDGGSLLGPLGVPFLGSEDALAACPHDSVVVAIGDNMRRAAVVERLEARGERFSAVIHPAAVIARDVTIGDGTMICAGVVVNTGTRIGAHAILNTGCSIDHHGRIGNFVHVGPGARLAAEVTVKDAAFIGTGAAVIPRQLVGADAVVGAGAVVTSEVSAGETVVGAPARSRRRMNL